MTKTQHKLSVPFQITVNRYLLKAKLLYNKVIKLSYYQIMIIGG